MISLASGTIFFSDCKLALSSLLDKKHLQYGGFIKKFEEAFADYLDVGYAYSFFKGRVSLSAILYALEFEPGDEIILPGYTCVVVPNALIYRGLKPVYVDIDPNTFNINPDDFERKITERTKGVILQYTYGLIPHLDRLLSIARRHDLKVIEDCAHALGAEYKGRKVGTFGDAAFFSTEESKVINTGVGGIAVTNEPKVAEKLNRFQRKCSFPECGEIQLWLLELIFQYLYSHPSHGWWIRELIRVTSWRLRSKLPVSTTNAECQGIKPESYEKRMPNALARIGLYQLKKLERFNAHRRKVARYYELALRDSGFKPIQPLPETKPVFLRYPVWVNDKDEIVKEGLKRDIRMGVWFSSVIHPAESALEKACYEIGSCPVGESAVEHVVNLPTHAKIEMRDASRITQLFREYYQHIPCQGRRGKGAKGAKKRHTMAEVIIRHWQDGDDKGIFELFDRTERWLSNESYSAKFNDEGLAPEGIILAEKDGLIIAHLMGTRMKIICEGKMQLFGGMGQLMVDENFRVRGIGKAMLQRIIQYHTKGGCRGILLQTQDYRIPAYPMYEKLGFRVVARRAFYKFQPEITKSSLSVVEPYTENFVEQTEEIRREWMRACFPVGVGNMKPADGNWWVIHEKGRIVGYVHIGQKDSLPILSHAVARMEAASEVCEALFKFIKELGHEEATWQTCVGSIWEEELHKRGFRDGNVTADVRMCLSIGSPIDTHGQRPEFDGCSTW